MSKGVGGRGSIGVGGLAKSAREGGRLMERRRGVLGVK